MAQVLQFPDCSCGHNCRAETKALTQKEKEYAKRQQLIAELKKIPNVFYVELPL